MNQEQMGEASLRRFWARVALPNEDGCMIWIGAKTVNGGYGTLWLNGKARRAHRLSLIIAEGLPPDPNAEVAHAPIICHEPSCVAPSHLRWASSSDNKEDQAIDGTRPEGERNGNAKLTDVQVHGIRGFYESGVTQRVLANQFGVSQALISHIVNRKGWRHL